MLWGDWGASCPHHVVWKVFQILIFNAQGHPSHFGDDEIVLWNDADVIASTGVLRHGFVRDGVSSVAVKTWEHADPVRSTQAFEKASTEPPAPHLQKSLE